MVHIAYSSKTCAHAIQVKCSEVTSEYNSRKQTKLKYGEVQNLVDTSLHWKLFIRRSGVEEVLPQFILYQSQIQMQTLRKSEIPKYLQKGELYRTLIENNDDPNEEVIFPVRFLKSKTSVKNISDCEHLLESLQFWGVIDFPSEKLCTFVLGTAVPTVLDVLRKYSSNFYCVHWLVEILATEPSVRWQVAIRSKMPVLVRCLARTGVVFPQKACDLAAEIGSLEILQMLHRSGLGITLEMGRNAGRHGHVEVLKFILVLARSCNSDMSDVLTELLPSIARAGHADCLQILYESGCEMNCDSCSFVAQGGHVDCLQYLHEKGCPWNEETCEKAADAGSLDCLKFLHENGCPWDETTCQAAAGGGSIACLAYAHDNGCPWDSMSTLCAATLGRIDCLGYAHENGCPWDEQTCRFATGCGQLGCLKYAHEHGCPLNITVDQVKRDNPCWEYLHQLA